MVLHMLQLMRLLESAVHRQLLVGDMQCCPILRAPVGMNITAEVVRIINFLIVVLKFITYDVKLVKIIQRFDERRNKSSCEDPCCQESPSDTRRGGYIEGRLKDNLASALGLGMRPTCWAIKGESISLFLARSRWPEEERSLGGCLLLDRSGSLSRHILGVARH